MKNKIIKLLEKLVSIDSIYPNEKMIGEYIFSYFKKAGYKPRKQLIEKNRYNIIVEKGSSGKTIVLYSHLDTVGIAPGWSTFYKKLMVNDDKAYGLGAWDMKGGMTINILTFLNYHPKNFKLKLIFCIDEENISSGAHALLNSGQLAKTDCLISTEPAFEYGLQGIVTGRIGRSVFKIEIIGESRHSAFYQKKYDINYFASKLLVAINELSISKYQFIFAKKIESSGIGMSIPGQTSIILESNIGPNMTHQEVLNNLKKISGKINRQFENYFKINIDFIARKTPFLESYEIKTTNKYLRLLSDSVYEVINKHVIPYFRSSVADENVFGAVGIIVLGIGPTGGNAHAPNEWVSLSSLEKLYNIIIKFLDKIDS